MKSSPKTAGPVVSLSARKIRLNGESRLPGAPTTVGKATSGKLSEADRESLIESLHRELIASLEWALPEQVETETLARELRPLAEQFCRRRVPQLAADELAGFVDDLMAELVGLGPLERLMSDGAICDILVNNAREVYVERSGRLERSTARFRDDDHLTRIIQRIAARVGRRIDESSPTVDARLPDGSRVHAVVPPLSIRGPALSIRRFGAKPLEAADLVAGGSLLPEMAAFLTAAIQARISLLVSGGTGAGKTTLLNALSAFIPPDERLVTIEDTAELRLQHPHVVALETRPANTEGSGLISARELLRNSLRMRPDRIIVGEVRGPEALDMLQAMNSGHEGSLTTIHANDTQDALSRLEMMVGMAGFEFPVPVMRQYIAAGIRLIVHVSRLKGGARRVTRISEILGWRDGHYELADVFSFEQTGIDAAGAAAGEFVIAGHEPQCLAKIRAAGLDLPARTFAARRELPPAGSVPAEVSIVPVLAAPVPTASPPASRPKRVTQAMKNW